MNIEKKKKRGLCWREELLAFLNTSSWDRQFVEMVSVNSPKIPMRWGSLNSKKKIKLATLLQSRDDHWCEAL